MWILQLDVGPFIKVRGSHPKHGRLLIILYPYFCLRQCSDIHIHVYKSCLYILSSQSIYIYLVLPIWLRLVLTIILTLHVSIWFCLSFPGTDYLSPSLSISSQTHSPLLYWAVRVRRQPSRANPCSSHQNASGIWGESRDSRTINTNRVFVALVKCKQLNKYDT